MNEAEEREIMLLLTQLKEAENIDIRAGAAEQLGHKTLFHDKIVPALVTALNDDNWLVRIKVAQALGMLGREALSALDALREAMKEPRNKAKRGVFYEVIQNLEQIKATVAETPEQPAVEAVIEPQPEEQLVVEEAPVEEQEQEVTREQEIAATEPVEEQEEELLEEYLEEAVEETLEEVITDVTDQPIAEDVVETVAEEIADEVIELGEPLEAKQEEQETLPPAEEQQPLAEEGEAPTGEITPPAVSEEETTLEPEKPAEEEPPAAAEEPEVKEESPAPTTSAEPEVPPEGEKKTTGTVAPPIKELQEEIVEKKPVLKTVEEKVLEDLKEPVALDAVLQFEEDSDKEVSLGEKERAILSLPEELPQEEAARPMKKYERTMLKVILLGDKAVGKTRLRKHYCNHELKQEYRDTIGADFVSKHLEKEGEHYTIQIWDIAPERSIEQVREVFYKGAKGVMLVFDVTNQASLEHCRTWLLEVKQQEPDSSFILVGNKIDLRTSPGEGGQVTTAEGQAFAEELSKELGKEVPYIEVSATTGENIEQAFNRLLEGIL